MLSLSCWVANPSPTISVLSQFLDLSENFKQYDYEKQENINSSEIEMKKWEKKKKP